MRDALSRLNHSGIEVRRLWKVFARRRTPIRPEELTDPECLSALEREGAVVAVRDVSLDVRPGGLFVPLSAPLNGRS